jgi:hypothetical protein
MYHTAFVSCVVCKMHKYEPRYTVSHCVIGGCANQPYSTDAHSSTWLSRRLSKGASGSSLMTNTISRSTATVEGSLHTSVMLLQRESNPARCQSWKVLALTIVPPQPRVCLIHVNVVIIWSWGLEVNYYADSIQCFFTVIICLVYNANYNNLAIWEITNYVHVQEPIISN